MYENTKGTSVGSLFDKMPAMQPPEFYTTRLTLEDVRIMLTACLRIIPESRQVEIRHSGGVGLNPLEDAVYYLLMRQAELTDSASWLAVMCVVPSLVT